MTKKYNIIRVKLNGETKNHIHMDSETHVWSVDVNESFAQIIGYALEQLGYSYVEGELGDNPEKLKNLHSLILNGFKFRIDETVDSYTLIVSKGKCSTSFSVAKEKGIVELLMQAEDWAETMLEELDHSKKISGVGINSY